MFPAETGASVERRPGDGLAVLLNELATGLLVGGCLRDDLLNAEDSKPLNSDLFFTGAGAGNVPEEKRSEWIPMASRVNRAEELKAVLGDGRGPEPPTLRLGATPSPDPPDDALSVSSEDSASRYSLAPSTDARRGAPWSAAAARTAPKMAAALPFLPEAA